MSRKKEKKPKPKPKGPNFGDIFGPDFKKNEHRKPPPWLNKIIPAGGCDDKSKKYATLETGSYPSE